MKAVELAASSNGCWRKIPITLNPPIGAKGGCWEVGVGILALPDTWNLAKAVRKVEFKLLHPKA
jgi:hypothetical protein